MQKISVKPQLIQHKGSERILIQFCYSPILTNIIRQIPETVYTRTYKGWHLPVEKELLAKIILKTREVADINTSELRTQLIKRKQNQRIENASDVNENSTKVMLQNDKVQTSYYLQNIPPIYKQIKDQNYPGQKESLSRIHEVNRKVLPEMKQHLQLKAYSNSTIKTYIGEMASFLQTIKPNWDSE